MAPSSHLAIITSNTPVTVTSLRSTVSLSTASRLTSIMSMTETPSVPDSALKDNDSVYSIEVKTPDYKSRPPLVVSPASTPSRRAHLEYQQINSAILGISTRLSSLEEGVLSRLANIQTGVHYLVNVTSVCSSNSSTIHSPTSSSGSLAYSDGTGSSSIPQSVIDDGSYGYHQDSDGYCVDSICELLGVPTPVLQPVPSTPVPSTPVLQPVPSIPVLQPSPVPSMSVLQPAPSAPVLPTSASGPSTPHPHFESAIGLTKLEVEMIFKESSSRKNFAARLTKRAFTEEERKRSNCHGKRGKDRLDPTRLGIVRRLTYYYYPLKQGQSEESDWLKECVKAIDEVNRRK